MADRRRVMCYRVLKGMDVRARVLKGMDVGYRLARRVGMVGRRVMF